MKNWQKIGVGVLVGVLFTAGIVWFSFGQSWYRTRQQAQDTQQRVDVLNVLLDEADKNSGVLRVQVGARTYYLVSEEVVNRSLGEDGGE